MLRIFVPPFLRVKNKIRPITYAGKHFERTQAVDRFLAAFAAISEPVTVNFSWRPLLGDPNDEMLAEIAVNARADAIVTHNVKDFSRIPERFGVTVLKPGDLLRKK